MMYHITACRIIILNVVENSRLETRRSTYKFVHSASLIPYANLVRMRVNDGLPTFDAVTCGTWITVVPEVWT